MDNISWPTKRMYDTAQAISTENENLLDEHTQHWQKIHDASTALPISMRETFYSFHTSIETDLFSALTLHKHIGQTLSATAAMADATDASIAQTFYGF